MHLFLQYTRWTIQNRYKQKAVGYKCVTGWSAWHWLPRKGDRIFLLRLVRYLGRQNWRRPEIPTATTGSRGFSQGSRLHTRIWQAMGLGRPKDRQRSPRRQQT